MSPLNRGQRPDSGQGDQRKEPPPPLRGLLIWFMIFAAVLIAYQAFDSMREGYEEIAYSPAFVDYIQGGRIAECEIVVEVAGRRYIRCDVKAVDATATDKVRKIRANISHSDKVEELLKDRGVGVTFVYASPVIWDLLTGLLPMILILVVLYFVFIRQIKSAGHGVMGFGRSRAKLLAQDKNKITFENVAGIDESKEEVQEIIEFLKDPKKFQKLGGRIPKGVLLMGPPGTGKTLLAKAIAGEAEVPFFNISGSDFVEMFVGVGASRVRDMFEQGKKSAPCLIFIDEIDAVGRSRFTGIGGGHDEREQTLNALLVEMDGFESSEGVIIIAATNRPDVLDPALLRPGRFDRQVVIDLPMLAGREDILKLHARKLKIGDDVELRRVARGTPGFSGADLENLLNESALLAAKADKEAVEMADMEEARDKVRWGREHRSRVLAEDEKRITAYHESGHALVTAMVAESEPLHKITIIPRGVAYLGATMQLPEKDRFMEGKIKLTSILTSYMGGRVAEELVFDDITSGARSDLKEATRIARLMICDWGMSNDLGPQTFGDHEELMFLGRQVNRHQDYSEDTAQKIDAEINGLLRRCRDEATRLLTENRDKLDQIAELLLERETIDGIDVDEIVEHGRLLSAEERKKAEAEREAEEKPKAGPSADEAPEATVAVPDASSDAAAPSVEPEDSLEDEQE
jgi:cell division protease FtsH